MDRTNNNPTRWSGQTIGLHIIAVLRIHNLRHLRLRLHLRLSRRDLQQRSYQGYGLLQWARQRRVSSTWSSSLMKKSPPPCDDGVNVIQSLSMFLPFTLFPVVRLSSQCQCYPCFDAPFVSTCKPGGGGEPAIGPERPARGGRVCAMEHPHEMAISRFRHRGNQQGRPIALSQLDTCRSRMSRDDFLVSVLTIGTADRSPGCFPIHQTRLEQSPNHSASGRLAIRVRPARISAIPGRSQPPWRQLDAEEGVCRICRPEVR